MAQSKISKELQKKFNDYAKEIWQIISIYQGILKPFHKDLLQVTPVPQLDFIMLDTMDVPLVFSDGATLKFGETIGVENGQLFWHKYTYQYQKADVIYFRYD